MIKNDIFFDVVVKFIGYDPYFPYILSKVT